MKIYALTGCIDGQIYYVDLLAISPSISGEIYSFQDSSLTIYCGSLISTYSIPISTTDYSVIQLETDCFNCYLNNGYTTFGFQGCVGGGYINITDFQAIGFLPTLYLTYNFSLDTFGNGCFTFAALGNGAPDDTLIPQTSNPSYIDCNECANRSRVVAVTGCDGLKYSALVPSGTVINDLITFTPIAEYFAGYFCGIVGGDSGDIPDITFISNYGQVGCETCLSDGQNANRGYVRRKLTSCLTGSQIIVEVSSLYTIGQSTYIVIADFGIESCFQIGEETTDPVDFNVQIGYNPQESCQDCINCNGAYFEFRDCLNNDFYYGFTRQYINVGDYYNDPTYGCGEIFGYQVEPLPTDLTEIIRVPTFSSCTDCQNYTPILWNVQGCDPLPTSFVVDMSQFTPAIGQVYRYDVINRVVRTCFTLLSEYTDPYSTLTQLNYLTATSTEFTDCQTCYDSTNFSVVIAECGTDNYQLVTIPGTSFTQIANFLITNMLTTFVMKDFVGRCYTPISTCYYGGTDLPIFTPYSLHDTCESCNIPFSAGTSTGFCFICCPNTTGETITNVFGPNPTWTNAQGYAIQLLDAVQLGGTNGLNN